MLVDSFPNDAIPVVRTAVFGQTPGNFLHASCGQIFANWNNWMHHLKTCPMEDYGRCRAKEQEQHIVPPRLVLDPVLVKAPKQRTGRPWKQPPLATAATVTETEQTHVISQPGKSPIFVFTPLASMAMPEDVLDAIILPEVSLPEIVVDCAEMEEQEETEEPSHKLCRLCHKPLPEDKKDRRLHTTLCVSRDVSAPAGKRKRDAVPTSFKDDTAAEPARKRRRRRVFHVVEEILGHERHPETGEWLFRVRWSDANRQPGDTDDNDPLVTLEPMRSFLDVHEDGSRRSVTAVWADYVEAVGIDLVPKIEAEKINT